MTDEMKKIRDDFALKHYIERYPLHTKQDIEYFCRDGMSYTYDAAKRGFDHCYEQMNKEREAIIKSHDEAVLAAKLFQELIKKSLPEFEDMKVKLDKCVEALKDIRDSGGCLCTMRESCDSCSSSSAFFISKRRARIVLEEIGE